MVAVVATIDITQFLTAVGSACLSTIVTAVMTLLFSRKNQPAPPTDTQRRRGLSQQDGERIVAIIDIAEGEGQ